MDTHLNYDLRADAFGPGDDTRADGGHSDRHRDDRSAAAGSTGDDDGRSAAGDDGGHDHAAVRDRAS